jgi:hypothetical protein
MPIPPLPPILPFHEKSVEGVFGDIDGWLSCGLLGVYSGMNVPVVGTNTESGVT